MGHEKAACIGRRMVVCVGVFNSCRWTFLRDNIGNTDICLLVKLSMSYVSLVGSFDPLFRDIADNMAFCGLKCKQKDIIERENDREQARTHDRASKVAIHGVGIDLRNIWAILLG